MYIYLNRISIYWSLLQPYTIGIDANNWFNKTMGTCVHALVRGRGRPYMEPYPNSKNFLNEGTRTSESIWASTKY